MNRRDMFKGAAGLGVGAALTHQVNTPQPYPPPSLDLQPTQKCPVGPEGYDPLWELKKLARQKANLEKEKLEAQLHREMEALSDLKSISPAYKRYRLRVLFAERDAVQARFYEWIAAI